VAAAAFQQLEQPAGLVRQSPSRSQLVPLNGQLEPPRQDPAPSQWVSQAQEPEQSMPPAQLPMPLHCTKQRVSSAHRIGSGQLPGPLQVTRQGWPAGQRIGSGQVAALAHSMMHTPPSSRLQGVGSPIMPGVPTTQKPSWQVRPVGQSTLVSQV
jgi:hypothetical protein